MPPGMIVNSDSPLAWNVAAESVLRLVVEAENRHAAHINLSWARFSRRRTRTDRRPPYPAGRGLSPGRDARRISDAGMRGLPVRGSAAALPCSSLLSALDKSTNSGKCARAGCTIGGPRLAVRHLSQRRHR